MKKIILIFTILLSLLFTGCDNNEGPFEIYVENGIKTLYSNGKHAKGVVDLNSTNSSGATVTVAKIEFDKGLPTGNFTIYNLRGYEVFRAEGKMEGKLLTGKIKHATGTVVEGEILIDINKLLDYNGRGYVYNIIDDYVNITETSKRNITKMEDGRLSEMYEYYDNDKKNLKTKTIYLKDENDTVEYAEDYYESGKLFRTYTLNPDKSMTLREYYENGERLSEGVFNTFIYSMLQDQEQFFTTMIEIPEQDLIGMGFKDFDSYIPSSIGLNCFKEDGITLVRIFDCIELNKYSCKYVDIKFYDGENDGIYSVRTELDTGGNILKKEYYNDHGDIIKK